MKTETVQEFLARGGQITVYPPGPKKYDHSTKYRKDKQLNALKQLKQQDGLSEADIDQIDAAIATRIQILKVTF